MVMIASVERGIFRDRRAARQSVERILQWDFDRVTVTHGEILDTGGRERPHQVQPELRHPRGIPDSRRF